MNRNFFLFLLISVFAFLVISGIKWGLPSGRIKKMYYSDERNFHDILKQIQKIDVSKSWEISKEKKNKLPRSYFNIIRSFHPDEEIIIKSLSNMNPKKLDFNPHYFVYPAFYTYIVGAVLYVLSIFKVVKLIPDITFYFKNPEEIAKLYLTGRIITVIFAILSLLAIFKIAEKCENKSGLFAILLTGFSPIFFINSHYMTVDITMIFFILLSFLFILIFFSTKNVKYLYISSIFVGFAGGVKYPGIFIWGIIPISLFFVNGWKFLKEKSIYLSFVITIFSFFAVNPYIILDYPEFKKDFISLMSDRSFSLQFFRNFRYSLINFVIACKNGLGNFMTCVCLISLVYSLFKVKKNKAILLFIVGFIFMLIPTFLTSGVKYVRYYLGAIIFLLFLTAFFLKDLSTIKFLKFGSFISTIFLLLPFLKTLAYTKLFYKEDVRILSGDYINKNYKKGTTFVFLDSPWIFEVPPVDNSKFKIKIYGLEEIDKMKKGEYLTVGELEYFLTMGSRKREMEKIINKIEKKNMKLVKIFKTQPEIFGINFYEDIVIHDMLYPQPAIFLFVKK